MRQTTCGSVQQCLDPYADEILDGLLFYIFVIRVAYILITITYCQRWPLSRRMVTIENDLLLEVGNHQVLPIFRWINLHMLQKKITIVGPNLHCPFVCHHSSCVNCIEVWKITSFHGYHHVTSSVLNGKIPKKSYKNPKNPKNHIKNP